MTSPAAHPDVPTAPSSTLTEAEYQAALRRINELWQAGAGTPGHPDHAAFDALHGTVTTHEQQLGLSAPTPDTFQITTAKHLEWYVGKKADIASRISCIKAQAAAMIKDLEREEERLDWRYAQQAEGVLRGELTGRRKSLKLLTGTVGLRKASGRLSVTDDAALQAAIPKLAPHLQDAITTRVDPRRLGQLLKVVGDETYAAGDGEHQPALPGLHVTPEREVFYVKAPGDRGDSAPDPADE